MYAALRSLAAALLFCAAGTPALAATPEERCEIAKNQAAGKFALCRQKAEAKAIARGTELDATKCDEKFAQAWQKADEKAAKAGATCPDGLATGDLQTFVTDHTGAVAVAVAGGGLPAVPPVVPAACTQPYYTLDEPDRNVGFNDGDGNVEHGDFAPDPTYQSPDWNGPGWYRFVGAAGTAMPESARADYDCGTDAPGWLNGTHPAVGDPVAVRQVCFGWSGDSCYWSTDVNVANCGDFYLYELPNTPETVLRYCGQ
jgi:hypothetical protein